MVRNTMESQINGMVNNLTSDIDKLMLQEEKMKVLEQMSARSSYKFNKMAENLQSPRGGNPLSPEAAANLKAEADLREQSLMQADDLTSLGGDETPLNMD